MATIRDVALKAGVGIGTVSRMMNGTGYVSDDTRKKIMDAVEALGYRPNELARNLSQNRSGIIGVMVPELTHPFFSTLTKYIETELYKRGYRCMICDVDDKPSRVEEFLELLQRNVMDGLITCVDKNETIPEIHRAIVAMDRDWGKNIPIVRSDHVKGAQLAAEIFIEEGCKKVLQFAPRTDYPMPFVARNVVLEKTLRENGIEVLTVQTDPLKMGMRYHESLSAKCAHYFGIVDGIFASDLVAAHCMKVAHQQGINVPRELKIVGYDGLFFTELLSPTLATVCQDIPEIAHCCVETVIKQINGGKHIPKEQVIDVSLRPGGSVERYRNKLR